MNLLKALNDERRRSARLEGEARACSEFVCSVLCAQAFVLGQRRAWHESAYRIADSGSIEEATHRGCLCVLDLWAEELGLVP